MRLPWQTPMKGRGLHFDREGDSRDYSFAQLPLGGYQAVRGGRLILPGGPQDQFTNSCCVGSAGRHAIVMRETYLGLPYDPPSELSMYAVARMRHTARQHPLRDTGTYIRAWAEGTRKVGASPERLRRMTTDKRVVNARVDWDELTASHDRRGLRYYWVFDHDKRYPIEAGIEAGVAFIFGCDVTSDFMDPVGPGIVSEMTGASRGGHAMAIGGIYRDGDVSVGPWIVQSWGLGYRMSGWCVMTWDLFNARARDVVAVDGWDRVSGRAVV